MFLAQRDGRLVGRRKLGGKGVRTQTVIADDGFLRLRTLER